MIPTRTLRFALCALTSLALGACLGDGPNGAKKDPTPNDPGKTSTSLSSGLQADGSIVVVRKSR